MQYRQHRELLRYWLHVLNGDLQISNPGEAGAKGSSLSILILAKTKLRLLPLKIPDFILNMSNCSGYSSECSFQHCGNKTLNYMTNFGMKGRKVCTINYYLHRKTFPVESSKSLKTVLDHPQHKIQEICKGRQPPGKANLGRDQSPLPFRKHRMQRCCICTNHHRRSEVQSSH